MRGVSLYWYRTESNFGDAFSPMAVRHVLGGDIVPAGKWDCDLVAEGSVLGFTLLRGGSGMRAWLNRTLRNPLRVWGSGLLFPLAGRERKRLIRHPQFLALRGLRTLAELCDLGLVPAHTDMSFGDPGLFMPEVLQIKADCRRGRGFVMHAVSWSNGDAEKFAREHPNIMLIDPRRSPQDVVRDIAGCAEIFSSSLHGLVAADALGVPNRWVELETPYADAKTNRFKFDDYYSAFGERRDPCRACEVVTGVPLDPVPSAKIDASKVALADALLNSYCQA